MLHAIDATDSGATAIHICSPDTDLLILALRRYPDLVEDTSCVTGSGKNQSDPP